MNIKIAFFDSKIYDINSFESVNKNFNYNIKYFEEHLNEDTAKLTKDFNVVCAFVNDKIDSKVIETLYNNNIKLIALRCAGYNNVDLKSAFGKIHVVRVPAYSPYAVAEHAVALMLTLNRKIHRAYTRTRDSNFNINGLLGFDMFGKTAGIIGTGKIGKIVINILKGFGMNILAYDPYPDFEFSKEKGFKYVDLTTLYKESDIISLHSPLTNDTHHMINKETLSLMKDNVMLINTSRGALINTKDLINALKSKKIGYAGLDVYEEESEYFFEDYSNEIISDDTLARLLTFNNVLITSHQAFFTKEALQNIAETTLMNVKEYFENNNLPNEICYKCGSSVCQKKTTGKCF
ncbi:MAG TPA: 2-hydroxyacid dehydrogenase [Spirochaetota bacterium]|nr:2-hydroxyacid dehydrogenase [Spirochaetota bacterium]HOL57825.1 2-hydroxyacid dehydrogenase [Spirochaetota bacterium]HPP05345.1 2-hydroxyacid dehydrogenase [Spirochaetota bacterium]